MEKHKNEKWSTLLPRTAKRTACCVQIQFAASAFLRLHKSGDSSKQGAACYALQTWRSATEGQVRTEGRR